MKPSEVLMPSQPLIFIPIVDEHDAIIGAEEKLAVHEKGLLHRAFSILVFNSSGQLLIHQRAFEKYHSGGLWTNTCCGHPNEGESMETAVHRRLQEEMGFDCPLEMRYKFHYCAEFENGLIENEIDHVYIGKFDGDFVCNPNEVADFQWVFVEDIEQAMADTPEKFTVWFREIIQKNSYALF